MSSSNMVTFVLHVLLALSWMGHLISGLGGHIASFRFGRWSNRFPRFGQPHVIRCHMIS